ncbi:MAG: hypothetical protein KKI02_05390, partial [Planctomycetes bacterium]|nr:hypothetical protein [Planctomycetota bacterium]
MTSISTPQQITGPQPYAIGSPIGSTTAAEAAGITFADVTRILKLRKMTVIITTIVLYVLVVLATVLIYIYAPAYTSEAIFELEPPPEGEMLMPVQGEVNTGYMEQLLKTEAAKIKNMGLMLEVVEQPEIKATKYYEWYDSDVGEAAVGLAEDLVSTPIPDTRLIRVALACRDKKEARLIVWTVVDRYRRMFEVKASDDMRQQTEGLENTLADLKIELEQRRGEL